MRSISRIAGFEGRMLTEVEAVQYCAMGRTAFRRWAQQIGAVRHFGKSVRYDRQTIDAELDRMAQEAEA